MAGLVKPDSLSTLGFANASASKLMMIATGIGSVSVYFLPTKYYQMLTLNLTDINNQGQEWYTRRQKFQCLATVELTIHGRIFVDRYSIHFVPDLSLPYTGTKMGYF